MSSCVSAVTVKGPCQVKTSALWERETDLKLLEETAKGKNGIYKAYEMSWDMLQPFGQMLYAANLEEREGDQKIAYY